MKIEMMTENMKELIQFIQSCLKPKCVVDVLNVQPTQIYLSKNVNQSISVYLTPTINRNGAIQFELSAVKQVNEMHGKIWNELLSCANWKNQVQTVLNRYINIDENEGTEP